MTNPTTTQPTPTPTSTVALWWDAIRPKTLTAAFVPVAMGTALAFSHGNMQWIAALAATFGAFFIQIGTNLANDYFDFKKGADTEERLGPTRVTASGLVSQRHIIIATALSFALAMLCGSYLVFIAGWPLVAVGLVSILCGIAYTGGPFPLAYNALGDLFVFIFFGIVAVVGTYYVQTLSLHPAAFVIAPHVGATATAILVVNNLRDIPTDIKANKRTLATIIGPAATRIQYILLLLLAFATPITALALGYGSLSWLLPLLSLPLAISLVRSIYKEHGSSLNPVLARTAKFQMISGLLFALGIALTPLTSNTTPDANPTPTPNAEASP